MTDAGKEIIEIFKTKKKFTLRGSKELWETLSYKNGKIIYVDSDYSNDDIIRTEISESEALKKNNRMF